MNDKPTDSEYRNVAKYIFAADGDIRIDDDARVSHADRGAWVAAWVFVKTTRTKQLRERTK